MTLRQSLPPALLLLGFLGSSASADERPDHFKGLVPATPAEAVQNFSAYNTRLEELLAREKLSAADLSAVHEMTYTLENALAVIDEELGNVAVLLEELHVASEESGANDVRTRGEAYLAKAREIIE